MLRTITIAAGLTAAAVAGVAASRGGATAPQAGHAEIGNWGFDLGAMDPAVSPGDDFYRYAGGRWMKNATIPPDRSDWGSFAVLVARSEKDVNDLIEELTRKPQRSGTIEQKVADYYSSFMDTTAIDAAGLRPFAPDLARIAALRTHEEVAELIGEPGMPANAPIMWKIGLDQKNPDRYALTISQAGLGMPDRDYYLRPDEKFAETRAAYRAYVEKMLRLAQVESAAAKADAIMALETRIAELQWPIERRRDREANYNPKTRAELKAFAPGFPWEAGLAAGGVGTQDFFIVGQPDAIVELARLFRETPVETWRAYLTFHYLNASADIMPTAFDDAAFEFNGRTLTGQEQKRDRWKRATAEMSGSPFLAPMGEAVGQLYVRRHFSPTAKAAVDELVDNLLAAYRKRIENLEWMSPETRQLALRKALTARVKIGYPERWRDYSQLEVRRGDVYGNRKRAELWDWQRQAARIDQKTDRAEWAMGPQTVNAYYNPVWNEIVFPAAILQAPFFDPNADPAINYGAIGGVIGHEMGHGYDDQGAKSDENGILRTWWKEEDEDRFKLKVAALASQYSSYEPLPGLRVNGDFTSGENIGDLGGLSVAHEACLMSLGGKTPPVLDGFTGEQRFFLGWAQIWRSIVRDEALRQQVTANVHSPEQYRVNGVVRNIDAWYAAFDVKEGGTLYLKPDERVHIW